MSQGRHIGKIVAAFPKPFVPRWGEPPVPGFTVKPYGCYPITGAFESGLAAFLVGTVPAVVGGGIMTMLIAVSWARFFPALAEVDRLQDIRPPEAIRLAAPA